MNTQPTGPELKVAMQRHHDNYVGLQREGKLKPSDQVQFDFAMERERQGLVKPLPVKAEESKK